MSKFQLGKIVITTGAKESINRFDVSEALCRHSNGDWGEIAKEDKEVNEQSLNENEMLLSAYTSIDKTKFWIITEADRSATTILLPSEY